MAASRDRVCELCHGSLCHGHHPQRSAPTQWRNEEAHKYVTSMQVQSDALMCKPCKDDVTRILGNSSLIPRWRKGSITDKNKCCILLCGQSVFVHGRLATNEQMQAALKLAGQKCTSDTVPVPVPLCKHHCHLVYNMLQPTRTNCITCGISLRHATPGPRLCLKPEKYLKDKTGFEGHIGEQDKVCYQERIPM